MTKSNEFDGSYVADSHEANDLAGQYVLGFLFSDDNRRVVLIRKQKPDWMRGRINGLGGKIKDGETPHDAMVREFEEKAGITLLQDWKEFCVYIGPWGVMHCFMASARPSKFEMVRTMTDEEVMTPHVQHALSLDQALVLPNVRWLINMALSFQMGERASKFFVREVMT